MNITNGRITEANIRFDRGCFLTATVCVEMDHGHQCLVSPILGGDIFQETVVANRHGAQKNYAADFIAGVMAVAEVDSWDDLKGKVVRVGHEKDGWSGPIIAIGHPIKDRWYNPKERFEALK